MGLWLIRTQLEMEIGSSVNMRFLKQAQLSNDRLSRFRGIHDILSLLRNTTRRKERTALAHTLLGEYRKMPHACWACLLLLAYHPLLTRIRDKIENPNMSDEDMDHLVIECFLKAAIDPGLEGVGGYVGLKLRQYTERLVFTQVQRAITDSFHEYDLEHVGLTFDQRPRRSAFWCIGRQSPPDSHLEPLSAHETARAALNLLRRQEPSHLYSLVVATVMGDELLSHFVRRRFPELTPDEQVRAYKRLWLERERALSDLGSWLRKHPEERKLTRPFGNSRKTPATQTMTRTADSSVSQAKPSGTIQRRSTASIPFRARRTKDGSKPGMLAI